MPAWLMSLLVQFLIEFLTQLFKKLFGAYDPASGKEQFMAKVKWRVWYGPSRMKVASDMYDHAVAKFRESKWALPLGPWQEANAAALANQLCSDLKKW